MVTDLAEIRRLGAAREAENLEFRRYLAAHHLPLDALQKLAEEVRHHIDCTTCANCCRCSEVSVDHTEIETIARFLGIEPADVTHQCTAPQKDAPALRILQTGPAGCIFLNGNLCTVYPARPKACREFPPLAFGAHSLGSRISSVCRWAALCPIVFNALEEFKHAVGFHTRRAPTSSRCASKSAGS